MKTALIYEWYTAYSGAERVNEQILKLIPDADLFALVDFLPDNERGFILNKKVTTSFLQKMPFARRYFRHYLPLMPLAIEQFDLSAYDIVISSNHAVAKGVITGPGQLHVCYCHSPIRYAWDLQYQYLRQAGLTRGLKSLLARLMLNRVRQWDYQSGARPDLFIANSRFIAGRIRKIYRREAVVIHPPVDVNGFALCTEKEDYYVTASRLVPYKRVDVLVEAFKAMPDKKLVVLGQGSEEKMLRELAKGSPNIVLPGYVSEEEMHRYMQRAKAFLFAAEEDFGISPVEAQACGTPVIAFGRGGALETVNPPESRNPTGLFFQEQTAEAVCEAVRRFEGLTGVFDPVTIRENALRFSAERFQTEFANCVEQAWAQFRRTGRGDIAVDERLREVA